MSRRKLFDRDGEAWTVMSSGPMHGGFRGIGEEYPEMDTVTLICTSQRGQTKQITAPKNWEALPDDDLIRRIEDERGGSPAPEDDER